MDPYVVTSMLAKNTLGRAVRVDPMLTPSLHGCRVGCNRI
jgi:hypothetical protein